MVIDIHAYWDEKNMTLDELRRRMREGGLTRVVLSPPCTEGFEPDKSPFMYAVQRVLLRSNFLRPIAETISRSFYNQRGELRGLWKLFTRHNKPINKVLEPANEKLLAAIAPFEEMYAWCWLNPRRLPPEGTLRALIQHPRVVGIKLHGYWHPFGIEEARPIFALAEREKFPIYFILGFGWLDPLKSLLKEFPGVDMIIGYGGFPYFDRLWRMIRPYPKVRIDLTSFHIDERGIRDAVDSLGADRCLYGSDCPYNFKDENCQFNYPKTILRICQEGIEEKAQQAILWRNAVRLLESHE